GRLRRPGDGLERVLAGGEPDDAEHNHDCDDGPDPAARAPHRNAHPAERAVPRPRSTHWPRSAAAILDIAAALTAAPFHLLSPRASGKVSVPAPSPQI